MDLSFWQCYLEYYIIISLQRIARLAPNYCWLWLAENSEFGCPGSERVDLRNLGISAKVGPIGP